MPEADRGRRAVLAAVSRYWIEFTEKWTQGPVADFEKHSGH